MKRELDANKLDRIKQEALVLKAIKETPLHLHAIMDASGLSRIAATEVIQRLYTEGMIVPCRVIRRGEPLAVWALSRKVVSADR